MVILLVVKRKVLGSLRGGSHVISVRKHICSAVNHIRVNFPGADCDLFPVRRAEVLRRAVGTADEQPWEHGPPRNTSFWEPLPLAHRERLHTVKRNAVLEQHHLDKREL